MAKDDVYKILDDVNFRVNRQIRFKNNPGWQFQEWPKDEQGFHAGDCDSYAITKAMELQRAGIEAKRMAIVATRLDDGQDHAVLRVLTPDGKYMFLDNRHPRPVNVLDGQMKAVFPHNSWNIIRKKSGQ